MLQCADARESFVVALVVDQRHICSPRCRADQEVNRRDTTMVAVGGRQRLQLAGSLPKLRTHLDRLERARHRVTFCADRAEVEPWGAGQAANEP
jgi:hypothetical protein